MRAAAFGWLPSLRGQTQGESNIQTHIKTGLSIPLCARLSRLRIGDFEMCKRRAAGGRGIEKRTACRNSQ